MNTVLVWVLVSWGSNNLVTYSPPVADLATCMSLQKELPKHYANNFTKCIQIRIVK